MRIVSMVPSWTETLIEAGADVVGRTRFCIHPKERVKSIPAVGGTKDWDHEKIAKLKPDLIILDQEENTREMAAAAQFPITVTHVESIRNMPGELKKLEQATGLPKLGEFAVRFEQILKRPAKVPQELPAVVEWIQKPVQPLDKIVYMIWKNPWMAVSRDTYIGSLLEMFLGPNKVLNSPRKYPEITLEELDEETTLLLFSTEPFPFRKQTVELRIGSSKHPAAPS